MLVSHKEYCGMCPFGLT